MQPWQDKPRKLRGEHLVGVLCRLAWAEGCHWSLQGPAHGCIPPGCCLEVQPLQMLPGALHALHAAHMLVWSAEQARSGSKVVRL